MGAKGKLGMYVGAILGVVLTLVQTACLSPEQQRMVGELKDKLDKAQASIIALTAERDKFSADAKAALARIEKGELPLVEGMALVRTALANRDELTAKIEAAVGDVKAVNEKIAEIRSKGTPWWAIALAIAVPLAGIASGFVPALSPIAKGLQMANQVVATRTEQLTATEESYGSVSRTLDALAAESPELTAKKQQLMLEEQARDTLADKDLYDRLRALAKAGSI